MSDETYIHLDYQPDLKNSIQNLSILPGFVLLESSDRSRGRYDIVTALPHDTLVIDEHSVNHSTTLDAIKEKLQPKPSLNDLPFQGGAIGYVSYDYAAELVSLKLNKQPSLNSVPLLYFGFYDWAIIIDHYQRKVTLFAANSQKETAAIVIDVLSIWNNSSENLPASVENAFQPLMTQDQYQHAFTEITQALTCGRSYQVNLTQPFHALYQGDAWQLYRRVSSTNGVPFSAFLRLKQLDILSFSPERLLLHQDGELLTSPIKGTIGRADTALADEQLKKQLKESIKNKAENVMIVDLLRNDLGKIAQPGTVEVTALCALQSFNSVHHLVSDIKAQARTDIHPFELFLSCFPGGSITGAPKLEAMHIINEQESFARGIYCGSIGYFSNHGRFDMNIAIRTITAKDNILHLAAGGGIVIDSEWQDEYGECYTKIAAIINGLK
ncbi:MAG: aminodeoxychorismate synthase component I [Legionella sp.]